MMRRIVSFLVSVSAVLLLASCRSGFVAIDRSAAMHSDDAFALYLNNKGIEIVDSNSVEILNGAHEKFERLLDDISRA